MTKAIGLEVCELETQQVVRPAADDRSPGTSDTSIVLVDPTLPDAPVIYVNQAFEQLTGYSMAETVGRNCRFLQGADTNQPGLVDLRQAMKEKRSCRTILRNYKKDGTFFWNDFHLTPVLNSQGEVSLFVGVQNPVTTMSLLAMTAQAAAVAKNTPGTYPPENRLGEILVAQGVVSRATVTAAVQLQQEGNKHRLGELLVEHFGVSEYAIMQALSVQVEDARARNSQTDLLMKTASAVRLAQTTMEAVPEKDLPIFSLCRPLSDAGGDSFYCLRLEDDSQLLLLADVAGHSVISSYAVASFLGMCCAVSDQLVLHGPQGMRAMFLRLNQCLLHGPFADVSISALAAHWDFHQGRLHIINAGMPHGFWFDRVGAPSQSIEVSGNPLGILPSPYLEEQVVALRPGERAIFGSDGLFEMLSPEDVMFQDVAGTQLDRLRGEPLGGTVATFCALSSAHGHDKITDDLLAVAIEQPPIEPPPYGFRMHMASTFEAIDTACERLVALLHSEPALEARATASEFELLLAAREALSNAVIHGNRSTPGKSVCFACTTEPPFNRLAMTITDEGRGFDLELHAAPEDLQNSERGRGIPVLRATTRTARMFGGELQLEFDLNTPGLP